MFPVASKINRGTESPVLSDYLLINVFHSLIHFPHNSFVLPRAAQVLIAGSAFGRIQIKTAFLSACYGKH